MTLQILGGTLSDEAQWPVVYSGQSVPVMSSADNSLHRPSVSECHHDSLTASCPGKYVLCSNYLFCVYIYSLLLLLCPRRGAEFCDQFVCVSLCVSVCLFTSISLEPPDRSSRNLLCRSLWPWLGPPPAALRYVMYFRFYGWCHVWP